MTKQMMKWWMRHNLDIFWENRIKHRIIQAIPAPVVRLALLKAATIGKGMYADEEVPAVTFVDVYRRWHNEEWKKVRKLNGVPSPYGDRV